MRYQDDDEAKLLNAERWQLDLLRANPPYCSWGPHEDYMSKSGDGWDSRQIVALQFVAKVAGGAIWAALLARTVQRETQAG